MMIRAIYGENFRSKLPCLTFCSIAKKWSKIQ
jgi:hypothetical protein